MVYNGFKNTYFFWVFILVFGFISCKEKLPSPNTELAEMSAITELMNEKSIQKIRIAQPVDYLETLQNKKVAIVANQTSVVENSNGEYTHLVDTLLSLNVSVVKVFSPEHGFRGKADAGEAVADSKDVNTGLPIFSLHGKNRKPSKEQLQDVDIVIFDIQDVGVRFYTYLSTMHYVMEACAENNIPVIIIDRPNPNAQYIDGPVIEKEHFGFLGMHPVPIVYGMTIGEYAQMINGEKWLKGGVRCNLTVMKLQNYSHSSTYSLPIKPSPNLPNDKAINLYPSLGLFEGTCINAGRGTDMQFQVIGAPFLQSDDFSFSYTPQPNEGAKNPKFKGIKCYGLDLRNEPDLNFINLDWLIKTYKATPKDKEFFQATFTAHAGTKKLQQMIEEGNTAEEIKATWQAGIENFKKVREKYLLYN